MVIKALAVHIGNVHEIFYGDLLKGLSAHHLMHGERNFLFGAVTHGINLDFCVKRSSAENCAVVCVLIGKRTASFYQNFTNLSIKKVGTLAFLTKPPDGDALN